MISLHGGSSSVPRSEVPVELVHLIIENLAVKNLIADIRSCSLVIKSWVPICRSYLFKEVEIGPIYTLQKRQFLVSILQKEPRLSNFIRKITFTSSSSDHTGNWADKSNCHKSLLALLQLPNVRNLSIKFSGGRDFATYMSDVQHFEWCSVMDRYLSTNQLTTISLFGLSNIDILSILSSQQLTTLQITDCEVVSILSSLPSLFAKQPSFQLKSLKARSVGNLCMPLLALCPHLEAMHLESLRFAKLDHDFDVPFVTTFPSLTTLNVGWVFDWEYPSTRQPFFPNIKSLELHYPFDASTLPQMCTLQSLQLDFDENEDALDWDVFSKLVNDSVRHLTHIQLAIEAEAGAGSILESLQEALSAIKGRNIIQSLSIFLRECEWSCDLGDWWETSHDAWQRFGDSLGNRDDYPCLRETSFDLEILFSDGSSEFLSTFLEEKGCPNFRSVLEGPLQGLMQRTDIAVQLEVDFCDMALW